MATKTFEELKQLAIQIRDEKTNKQNTATRVGTAMLEHINKLEQDYYDKTKTDEELKKRDNKLTELSNNVGLYNVDKNVPLGSGFYTSTTARAAVPEDVRKIGLIITYKTDEKTSVTEQFTGSDISAWATDSNWKNVGSEGGNKILTWDTDAATTRKQVKQSDRRSLLQISYRNSNGKPINEQYIGTAFNDTEWEKDENWVAFADKNDIATLQNSLSSVEGGVMKKYTYTPIIEDFDYSIPIEYGTGVMTQCYNINPAFSGIQPNGVEIYIGNKLDLTIYAYNVNDSSKTELLKVPKEIIKNKEKNIFAFSHEWLENEVLAVKGNIYYSDDALNPYKGCKIGTSDFPNATITMKPLNVTESDVNVLEELQKVEDIPQMKEDIASIQVGNMIEQTTYEIDANFTNSLRYESYKVCYNTNEIFKGLKIKGVKVKLFKSTTYQLPANLYAIDTETLVKKLLATIPYDDIVDGDYNLFNVTYQLGTNETIAIESTPYYGNSDYNGSYFGSSSFPTQTVQIIPIALTEKQINIIDEVRKGTGGSTSKSEFVVDSNNIRLGSMPFQSFPIKGYAHIIINGQSLSTGDNSYIPVTGIMTDVIDGTYMIGNSPGDITGELNQMKAGISTNPNGGECPIVNAVYALKNMINRTAFQDIKIIGTAVGQGGVSIEALAKGGGLYQTRFIGSLNTVKADVGGETVVCPAIIWMQGEYNQGTASSTTKDEYKEKITQLKNDMQSDIMSVYEQKEKPLFFVYQTSRFYTPKFPVVAQALFEFAQENSDVILMNPHYFCPTSDGGHLTANGYRWYGEYIAKAIFEAVFYNNRYKAIQPKKVTINQTEVSVELAVPYLPIKVDTGMIKEQSNYGFALYKGEEEIQVLSAKAYPTGIITLTSSRDLTDETDIYLEYAGQKTNGAGNIRDSDEYVAFSEFIDSNLIYTEDGSSASSYAPQAYINNEKKYDENGELLIGKPYPMYNWLNTFRIKIK